MSPRITTQWRKPVTKHKNSLELPGTAAYSGTGVPGGVVPTDGVKSDPGHRGEMGDRNPPVRDGFQGRRLDRAGVREASLQLGLHLLRVRALGLVTLPLANGVGVLYHQLIHPCQGLGEQHGALKEAQVAPVQRQHKHDVLPFLCGRGGRKASE